MEWEGEGKEEEEEEIMENGCMLSQFTQVVLWRNLISEPELARFKGFSNKRFSNILRCLEYNYLYFYNNHFN